MGSSFAKIPFSKSEIFTNQSLSLKEKRALVKLISISLHCHDLYSEEEKNVNSTHIYDQATEVAPEEIKEFEGKKAISQNRLRLQSSETGESVSTWSIRRLSCELPTSYFTRLELPTKTNSRTVS